MAWAVEDPDGNFLAALAAAAKVRSRAAAARTRAALDREAAARDREEAARDRELLVAELERSQLDQLTGAYGKAMGDVLLRHEIERAGRSHGSLALALIEINQPTEDSISEADRGGDQLLRDAFAALKRSVRPYDPVVRWADDKFLCAVSESTPGKRWSVFIEDVRGAPRRAPPARCLQRRLGNVGR